MRPTPAATCRGRPASWQYPTAPRRSVACYHRSSKLLTDSRLSVSRVFLIGLEEHQPASSLPPGWWRSLWVECGEGAMFEPPSPDTRIATAPASAASSLLTDPGHGSQRAPFGMDTQRSAPTQSTRCSEVPVCP